MWAMKVVLAAAFPCSSPAEDRSRNSVRAMVNHTRATIKIARYLILLLGWELAFDATAGELEPTRITLTREASAAPLFIAIAAGYFKGEGLEPQLTFLETDTAVSAAVASGKMDIGMASLSTGFYSFAAAHNLKMIASRS